MNNVSISKVIGIFLLTFLSAGCGSDNNQPPAPPVIVSKPVQAMITDYLTETGNTVAYNSVNLVARVAGYLDTISFTDGTFVKKGDPLFVIQPEPYQAQLEEAQATLAADKATYTYDKAEYQRQLTMYKQNATSMAEVQKWLSTMEAGKAAVDSAKANLVNAQINYGYTHISAPFDGRIGRHLVDVGNLVGNGAATNLATIEQVDPIYVYFNINELDILKLRALARKQGFKPGDINKIAFFVGLQNETGFPHKGHLDFVSTGLDTATGTIQIRGVLDNKNYVLLPGLFVRARIAIGQPVLHSTVPESAIMYDQIGSYVFTVDKNNIVVQTRVTTGSSENGMITVLTGVKPDDHVIIDGLQNATPGDAVAPKEKDLALNQSNKSAGN